MSLISQNSVSKDRIKSKREDKDDPFCLKENGAIEDGKDSDLDNMKSKKRQKQEKQVEIEEEKEKKKLENLLFGSLYSPVEFGKEDEETDKGGNGSALFFTDRSANSALSVYEEDADFSEDSDEEESKQKKAVWVDDEEETANINIGKVNRLRKLRKEEGETVVTGSEYVARLRAQHAKLNPGTEWAQLGSRSMNDMSSDDESADEDGAVDDILRTNEDLVVKSGAKLLPGRLEFSKLVDANAEDPSNAVINSVQFHRNGQLLLAGGLDKKLRFFQIDGKRNTKIQSIFLDDCPIRSASFMPDGSQVIISGRRKFFYSFDLVSAKVDKIGPLIGREEKSLETFVVSPDSSTIAFVGNEGYILLVSSKTKELIGTVKMNGTVRSLAFADNGRQLLSSGGDGHIYHWDLRTRTCFHKAVDEGCLTGTALSTSPSGTLFAAGSDSGYIVGYALDDIGSGSHVHLSLWQNEKNVFMADNSSSRYGMSTIGEEFMAGVLHHLPSIMALTAPVPNSYDRIQPNTWSGAYQCWGRENRESPIRTACPPGTTSGLVSNFEIKSFDGCANPYLGLSAIVAAGIDGLQRHLSLPAPVDINPADIEAELRRLPKSLSESLEALMKDHILEELLGEKLLVAIKGVRKAEIEYYSKNEEAYKNLIHRY